MTIQSRLQQSAPHLVVALVTPFTAEGEIDRASLTRLIEYLFEGGVQEYFVSGSTGEAPLLDERDRVTIIETVRKAAPNSLIYAGVSGTGPRSVIHNCREAAKAGADVGVLMSPWFIALNQEQLAMLCTTVADGSPLPIALYHHLRMPTPFAVPTVAQLSTHPNIIGIKDTNGADNDRCAEILAATAGRPFLFFQGIEKLALPSLMAGSHGSVVAQANIAPRLFRSLFDAWQKQDLDTAHARQEEVTALWKMFRQPEVSQSFLHFVRTMKLPLQQRGILASAACALPNATFDAEFDKLITDYMQENLKESIPSAPAH